MKARIAVRQHGYTVSSAVVREVFANSLFRSWEPKRSTFKLQVLFTTPNWHPRLAVEEHSNQQHHPIYRLSDSSSRSGHRGFSPVISSAIQGQASAAPVLEASSLPVLRALTVVGGKRGQVFSSAELFTYAWVFTLPLIPTTRRIGVLQIFRSLMLYRAITVVHS